MEAAEAGECWEGCAGNGVLIEMGGGGRWG